MCASRGRVLAGDCMPAAISGTATLKFVLYVYNESRVLGTPRQFKQPRMESVSASLCWGWATTPKCEKKPFVRPEAPW